MKTLLAIFLAIILNTCGNTKATTANQLTRQDKKSIVLQYTELSRGVYRKVSVNNNTISQQLERDGKISTKKISKSQWNELMALLEQVNINDIAKLEAPSNKSASDIALIATLTVNKDGQKHETYFDHDNPHAAIAELVNKLVTLGELRQ